MKQKKPAAWLALLLTFVIGLAVYGWQGEGLAFITGKEVFKVGHREIVVGDEGNSEAGGYKDPVQDGPNVKTIVLAYTCVGDKVLFNKVIPEFKEYWKGKTGEQVRFVTGYSLPGFDTVATRVSGKPVQVLIMTSASDPVKRGYGHTKWRKESNKGVVYGYPQVFLVRKGNPKNIRTYADLAGPGIQVVHVNPFEGLGTGLWAVYGIYGSALRDSEVKTGNRDTKAAFELFKQVEENAFYGSATAEAAGRMFLDGAGDVLIISENRALKMVRENDTVEMVVPPNTVVADMTVYKMDKNVKKKDDAVIDGFVDFLFTEQVQEAFAQYGFRPTDPNVLANHPEFTGLENPFHIDFLGNATDLKKDIILDKWIKVNNGKKQGGDIPPDGQ